MAAKLPDALTVAVPPGAIALVLPLPPSLNHIWRTAQIATASGSVQRTYKSKRAKDYSRLVWAELKRRHRGALCPALPLRLTVRLLLRGERRIDASNAVKVVEDALIGALKAAEPADSGRLIDDAAVHELHVYKLILPPRRGGPVRCEIILEPATMFPFV